MGTRASVISICKGPALTKARLLGAAARVLPARRPAPARSARSPGPTPPPPRTPSPPRLVSLERPGPSWPPGHPLPRCRSLLPARGDNHRPAPARQGKPQPVPVPGPPGRAGPRPQRGGSERPPRTPRPRGGGPRERAPRLPRPGAQAPGAAAGAMAAGALGARRRRRQWQRDGRAQRARLPARPRPPEALDAGEEGPGPRGEEEPGRRRPGRGSSSAARAAGAAEGGALGAARALAGSVPPPLHPFHGDCASGGRSTEECGPGLAVTRGGHLGDLNLEAPGLAGAQMEEVSRGRPPAG